MFPLIHFFSFSYVTCLYCLYVRWLYGANLLYLSITSPYRLRSIHLCETVHRSAQRRFEFSSRSASVYCLMNNLIEEHFELVTSHRISMEYCFPTLCYCASILEEIVYPSDKRCLLLEAVYILNANNFQCNSLGSRL